MSRVADTKKEILSACLGYFIRNGIWEMTNVKLATRLGISTKTLYKYFKDKEDLIARALELFFARQYEDFKALPKGESAAVILFDIWRQGFEMEFGVNKKLFRDLHHYYPDLEKKVEMQISKRFWKGFIAIINRGIGEGDIRGEIDPEAALEGISVLYLAIVRKGEFNRFGLSPDELLCNTIVSYIRGISTEKGVRILDEHLAAWKAREKKHITESKLIKQ